eukprot:augustus_masked-scaffold_7-processed-gene-13.14-mRNA-1 protein AED:1.00 eAED:1.00 QI:0/-1/0/0/-1/1/1/0/331
MKCPLCPLKRQKSFKPGRSIRKHLESKHCSYFINRYKENPNLEINLDSFMLRNNLNASQEQALAVKEKPHWIRLSQEGDIEGLRKIMKDGIWSWNSKDQHGSIAEHYAAGSGKLDCLYFLKQLRRASCDACSSSMPSNKCICAINEIKKKRSDGRFSIHWAVRNNQVHIVDYLVDSNLEKLSFETSDGTKPIHFAALSCNYKLLESFSTREDVDFLATNSWNCKLCHFIGLTTEKNEIRITKTLEVVFRTYKQLNSETSFRSLNKEEHSILHKAATKGNLTILTWIKQHFSITQIKDLCRKDKAGNNPSDLATRCNQHEFALAITEFEGDE